MSSTPSTKSITTIITSITISITSSTTCVKASQKNKSVPKEINCQSVLKQIKATGVEVPKRPKKNKSVPNKNKKRPKKNKKACQKK